MKLSKPSFPGIFSLGVLRTRRKVRPGEQPGRIESYPGAEETRLFVVKYDDDELIEEEIADLSDPRLTPKDNGVTWINVTGLANADLIKELGKMFGMHPLSMEDVVQSQQRAKSEEFDDLYFIIMRAITEPDTIKTEQISMVLSENCVITFQEHQGDCFDLVRKRLRNRLGRIRKRPAHYLAYALLDAAVDSYFPVIDQIGAIMEKVEERVTSTLQTVETNYIHSLRSQLLLIQKNVRPHAEMVASLIRTEHGTFAGETKLYLRDVHDNVIYLLELIESYKEACADLRNYQLSLLQHRMNEIMKVLAIISTIFIPLSFIAGLYGMNFDTSYPTNMPELRFEYGYVAVLSVMGAVALVFLIGFARAGWLGNRIRLRWWR